MALIKLKCYKHLQHEWLYNKPPIYTWSENFLPQRLEQLLNGTANDTVLRCPGDT